MKKVNIHKKLMLESLNNTQKIDLLRRLWLCALYNYVKDNRPEWILECSEETKKDLNNLDELVKLDRNDSVFTSWVGQQLIEGYTYWICFRPCEGVFAKKNEIEEPSKYDFFIFIGHRVSDEQEKISRNLDSRFFEEEFLLIFSPERFHDYYVRRIRDIFRSISNYFLRENLNLENKYLFPETTLKHIIHTACDFFVEMFREKITTFGRTDLYV
jgi:hypothetical protein